MERDEETGLAYHGARHYITWLGRWSRADPIGIGDGVNVYAYVNGHALSVVDPTGMAEDNAIWTTGSALLDWAGEKWNQTLEQLAETSKVLSPATQVMRYVAGEDLQIGTEFDEVRRGLHILLDVGAHLSGSDVASLHSQRGADVAARFHQVSHQQAERYVTPESAKFAGHTMLDVGGLAHPAFDAANTLWYLTEGDIPNVVVSAASIVPIGDVLKLGKQETALFELAPLLLNSEDAYGGWRDAARGWREVEIDFFHIRQGHVRGGPHTLGRNLWPGDISDRELERVIRNVYGGSGERVNWGLDGNRYSRNLLIRGQAELRGKPITVEMFYIKEGAEFGSERLWKNDFVRSAWNPYGPVGGQ
jgi:RHS repeat-associated protein